MKRRQFLRSLATAPALALAPAALVQAPPLPQDRPTRLAPWYPRPHRLIHADDLESTAIRGIHITAGTITVSQLAERVKASVEVLKAAGVLSS